MASAPEVPARDPRRRVVAVLLAVVVVVALVVDGRVGRPSAPVSLGTVSSDATRAQPLSAL